MKSFEFEGQKFKVIKINSAMTDEADILQGKIYADYARQGFPLDAEIENIMRERGLLEHDKSLEDKATELRRKLKDLEKTLRSAEINDRAMTKDEGRDIALSIKDTRIEIGDLGVETQSSIATAESRARNERLTFLIHACVLNDATNERYWKSYEDYKNEENNELLGECTRQVLAVNFDKDVDYEKKNYENQWLIRMGFMNDKLKLINAEGHLISRDGQLIDEKGYYVDGDGNKLDEFGNAVDDDGNLILEDNWGGDEKTLVIDQD